MTTITELQIINDQLDKANQEVERFKTKRLNAIVACLNNGVSVKEVSDALGLSRQRVYKIIEKR
jgi:DNA-binding NarL/FixJ family response regulator